jgi:hypothetical protein
MRNRRIFYLAYDDQRPNGGQKHTYQHVDALARNGFEAYVVHKAPGFRLTWFENETPVIDYDTMVSMYSAERDFMALPEDLGPAILNHPGRKVIFNKNIFRGFTALGGGGTIRDPYLHEDVVAAFVVSSHNAQQLRYAYPRLDVHEVTMDLRPAVFTFRPLKEKARQVATIAKTKQTASVYHICRARGEAGLTPGGPCQWLFIRDVPETAVAHILGESLLFVFQSAEEGLGRLPLEALLSGCVVLSYAAGPLKNILPASFCCDYAEPARLAGLVERTLAAHPHDLAALQDQVNGARDRVLHYRASEQERTVCAAWEAIFVKAPMRLAV